jgi:hypothetical protein
MDTVSEGGKTRDIEETNTRPHTYRKMGENLKVKNINKTLLQI